MTDWILVRAYRPVILTPTLLSVGCRDVNKRMEQANLDSGWKESNLKLMTVEYRFYIITGMRQRSWNGERNAEEPIPSFKWLDVRFQSIDLWRSDETLMPFHYFGFFSNGRRRQRRHSQTTGTIYSIRLLGYFRIESQPVPDFLR